MAGRILGRGDVVSLVEQVAGAVDANDAESLGRSVASGGFTLEDFLTQMKMMRRMGPLDKLMGMMPGMGQLSQQVDPAQMERELKWKEAIVFSMTRQERKSQKILNGSRRARIARGAGVEVSAVNRFLREFEAMEKMMRKFMGGGMKQKLLKGLTQRAFS
jgi:signal recognition particle subunit SRP54